jgi:hypothetical protein
MRKNILSVLLVFLLATSSLILSSCGGEKMYKMEDIKSIYYYEVLERGDKVSGEIDLEQEFTIYSIYDGLKQVNYNKTRPEKDFWTKKKIEYKEQKSHSALIVTLKDGTSKMYYFFYSNVYPSLLSMKYSEKGYGAAVVARGHLVDKQLK